jgi:hypothetical protein
MPTRRHYRRPNPDRRRALELRAGSRYGYTKAILRAHGFSIDMIVELTTPGYQNNALCPGSLATIMLPPTMRSYQGGGLLVGTHASRLDDGNPPIGFGLEQ